MFRDLKISNSHTWEELTKDLSFIYKFLEENCDCLDRAMFFKSDFVGFKSDFKFEELKCFVLGFFIFDYHFPDGFEMDFDNEREREFCDCEYLPDPYVLLLTRSDIGNILI